MQSSGDDYALVSPKKIDLTLYFFHIFSLLHIQFVTYRLMKRHSRWDCEEKAGGGTKEYNDYFKGVTF